MSASIAKRRDPASRLFQLLDFHERRLSRQFLEMVKGIKSTVVLKELEALLLANRVLDMVELVTSHVGKFADQVNDVYISSADDTAAVIALTTTASFDKTNARAVAQMKATRLRVIRNFTEKQSESFRAAIEDAAARGLSPRRQVREVLNSVGLTERQQRAVDSYRRLLETSDRRALERSLRDKRFDRTIIRSVRERSPLTRNQIDRMVNRYRERYLKHRAETISQTEALSAVHEGNHEMYSQAIESGIFGVDELEQEWYPARDSHTRHSHSAMRGQVRPFGEVFVSGNGVPLRYPGDSAAPASERIRCRCAVGTRPRRVSNVS